MDMAQCSTSSENNITQRLILKSISLDALVELSGLDIVIIENTSNSKKLSPKSALVPTEQFCNYEKC